MPVKFCKPIIPDISSVEYYLKNSISIGHLSNFGPAHGLLVERLNKFWELEKNKEILLTSSGHTALMAAYASLGVKKLLVPAFTFQSTAVAASLQGIEVVLSDVDPNTGCLTPEIISIIDPDTYDSVVVVCALSTIPDLKGISKLCSSLGKTLIIDGAATFGTTDISNFGDAFCYSFHATKTFSAGEAGALIINSPHYDLAKSFINFGFDKEKNVCTNGLNGKVSDYTCAISLSLLDIIEAEIESRIDNFREYKKIAHSLIPYSYRDPTVYAFLPLFFPTPSAAQNARRLFSLAGVENISYYKPIEDLPVAVDLYSRSVCLPIHSGITSSDFETIEHVLKDL